MQYADSAAASQHFYKEAYLDFGQLLTDGFYHVRKQFNRLPSLSELEANPQLAGGQVVMVVDRARDQPLVTLEVWTGSQRVATQLASHNMMSQDAAQPCACDKGRLP